MAHMARNPASPTDADTDSMLAGALQQAGIMLFRCDLDLRYPWLANPLPGLSPVAMMGLCDKDIFARDEADALLAFKHSVLTREHGAAAEFELTVHGRVLSVEARAEVTRNADGCVDGLTGALIDITIRKAAEAEALRVAEHDRIFARATREGVLLHDGERV